MKFCVSCGMQLNDEVNFCVKCGAAQPAQQAAPVQQPVQPPVQYAQPVQQPVQPPVNYAQPPVQQPVNYAQPPVNYAQPPVQPGFVPQPMSPLQAASMSYGMGWFKFLIYFALIAGAILNAISGVTFLTGAVYEGNSDQVYAVFEDLEILDTFYGVGMIAFAILQIVTRMRLAGFKRGAGNLVVICYVLGAVISLAYIIAWYAVMPELLTSSTDPTSVFVSTAVSFFIAAANATYFGKRKALFVH